MRHNDDEFGDLYRSGTPPGWWFLAAILGATVGLVVFWVVA